ncbi:MAG: hypothetical protein NTX56_08145 [Proteobacteria bacterium]|nr:hypothetical protein [Pseudomonadota bacterium]
MNMRLEHGVLPIVHLRQNALEYDMKMWKQSTTFLHDDPFEIIKSFM